MVNEIFGYILTVLAILIGLTPIIPLVHAMLCDEDLCISVNTLSSFISFILAILLIPLLLGATSSLHKALYEPALVADVEILSHENARLTLHRQGILPVNLILNSGYVRNKLDAQYELDRSSNSAIFSFSYEGTTADVIDYVKIATDFEDSDNPTIVYSLNLIEDGNRVNIRNSGFPVHSLNTHNSILSNILDDLYLLPLFLLPFAIVIGFDILFYKVLFKKIPHSDYLVLCSINMDFKEVYLTFKGDLDNIPCQVNMGVFNYPPPKWKYGETDMSLQLPYFTNFELLLSVLFRALSLPFSLDSDYGCKGLSLQLCLKNEVKYFVLCGESYIPDKSDHCSGYVARNSHTLTIIDTLRHLHS